MSLKINEPIMYHMESNQYVKKSGIVKKINKSTVLIDSFETGLIELKDDNSSRVSIDLNQLKIGDSFEYKARSNQQDTFKAKVTDIKNNKITFTYIKPVLVKQSFLEMNFDPNTLIKSQEKIEGTHIESSQYDRRRRSKELKQFEESLDQEELMKKGIIENYDKRKLFPIVDVEKEIEQNKSMGHILYHTKIQDALQKDKCKGLNKTNLEKEKQCHDDYLRITQEVHEIINKTTTLNTLQDALLKYSREEIFNTDPYFQSNKNPIRDRMFLEYDAKKRYEQIMGKSFMNYIRINTSASDAVLKNYSYARDLDILKEKIDLNTLDDYLNSWEKNRNSLLQKTTSLHYYDEKEQKYTFTEPISEANLTKLFNLFVNRKEIERQKGFTSEYNDEFKEELDKYSNLEEKRFQLDKESDEILDVKIRDLFGIRTIQYGVSLSENEKKDMLKLTYGALYDLSKVLNLSTGYIGLNINSLSLPEMNENEKNDTLKNNLAISLGARGKGKALAHYEPELNVINLTKRNGNGSLAHEWGHALDYTLRKTIDEIESLQEYERYLDKNILTSKAYYDINGDLFSCHPSSFQCHNNIMKNANNEIKTSNYLSNITRVIKLKNGSNELNETIMKLNKEIRNGDFCKNAGKKSKSDKKDEYWSDPKECFARAFESYIGDRSPNRFLALDTTISLPSFQKVYPQQEERKKINALFDTLFTKHNKELEEMIEKSTEKK